jgi:hypothetical protein
MLPAGTENEIPSTARTAPNARARFSQTMASIGFVNYGGDMGQLSGDDEWRVHETMNGRSGTITYSEGGNVLTLYAEIGAGDAVLLVSGPPPQDWAVAVPWAADRRREVMERVAGALTSEHPRLIASFGDDYMTITLCRRPRP